VLELHDNILKLFIIVKYRFAIFVLLQDGAYFSILQKYNAKAFFVNGSRESNEVKRPDYTVFDPVSAVRNAPFLVAIE